MNKRNLLGFSLYCLFRPFVRLPKVLSVYFHNPSTEAFEKTIRWIADRDYEFVTVENLILYMQGGYKPKGRIAIVTFDDAWRDNLKLIPVIEKYNVPITIFAPIEPLLSGNYWWEYAQKKGGYSLSNRLKELNGNLFNNAIDDLKNEVVLSRSAMTIDELCRISKHPLISIESHSYSHPILTNLSEPSLNYELSQSKQYLSEILKKDVQWFCFPNGSLTEREIRIAQKYYKGAFSTIQDVPKVGGDVYKIPRYALNDDYWVNLAMMIGIWKWFVKY